jgi:hypothetical protein
VNQQTWRYLTVGVTVVALTLTVLAANATVLSTSDVETGDGLRGIEGIRTSDSNVTTTDDGITRFWIDTHAAFDESFDLRTLRVYWDTPEGNHTLELADERNPSELSGNQFTVRIVEDTNNSIPTVDHPTDTVRIFVRPPTFLDENESRLGPVTVTIDADGIHRERIIIRNVTGDPTIEHPLTTITEES